MGEGVRPAASAFGLRAGGCGGHQDSLRNLKYFIFFLTSNSGAKNVS